MAVEVEVKIHIGDLEAFRARLAKAEATVIAERYRERNQLYTSPHRDFEQEGIVLRLRRDAENKIALKTPSHDTTQGTNTRNEFETTIGDMQVMDDILRQLGYKHGPFYEKYRTIYVLPGSNAEIMVDELPFGNFVEIEGTPGAIEDAIQRLGLEGAHRIHTNYAGLLRAVERSQGLNIEKATFNSFELIKVDPSLFEGL